MRGGGGKKQGGVTRRGKIARFGLTREKKNAHRKNSGGVMAIVGGNVFGGDDNLSRLVKGPKKKRGFRGTELLE